MVVERVCQAHEMEGSPGALRWQQARLNVRLAAVRHRSLSGSVVLFSGYFDGVIKETIEVTAAAFVCLFLPFGEDVAARVRAHHKVNGEMSRFEKMRIYLEWASEEPTEYRQREFCDRFSQLVLH